MYPGFILDEIFFSYPIIVVYKLHIPFVNYTSPYEFKNHLCDQNAKICENEIMTDVG